MCLWLVGDWKRHEIERQANKATEEKREEEKEEEEEEKV
jgi:hypothetical protein